MLSESLEISAEIGGFEKSVEKGSGVAVETPVEVQCNGSGRFGGRV